MELFNHIEYKPAGKDKWLAKCPCHGDKDYAMSIKMEGDKVLAHCFACGANGFDLYSYLNLDMSELMGEKLDSSFMPAKVKDQLDYDKHYIAVVNGMMRRNEVVALADKREYRKANARITGAQEKWGRA